MSYWTIPTDIKATNACVLLWRSVVFDELNFPFHDLKILHTSTSDILTTITNFSSTNRHPLKPSIRHPSKFDQDPNPVTVTSAAQSSALKTNPTSSPSLPFSNPQQTAQSADNTPHSQTNPTASPTLPLLKSITNHYHPIHIFLSPYIRPYTNPKDSSYAYPC